MALHARSDGGAPGIANYCIFKIILTLIKFHEVFTLFYYRSCAETTQPVGFVLAVDVKFELQRARELFGPQNRTTLHTTSLFFVSRDIWSRRGRKDKIILQIKCDEFVARTVCVQAEFP